MVFHAIHDLLQMKGLLFSQDDSYPTCWKQTKYSPFNLHGTDALLNCENKTQYIFLTFSR